MSLRVPAIPPLVCDRVDDLTVNNDIRIGTPVLGQRQWRKIAEAQNWLLGGGCAHLATFGPKFIEAGGTTTYRTYCWPRKQCYSRLWVFRVRGNGAYGAVTVTDGLRTFEAPGSGSEVQTIMVTELVDAPEPSGEAITIQVELGADSPSLSIVGVSCFDLPQRRVGLLDNGGWGTHQDSCNKWHPIIESSQLINDKSSVDGVVAVAAALLTGEQAFRRTKLLDWSLNSGVTTSSSTFSNIFVLDPFLQTRQVRGETQRLVKIAIRAAATGSAGSVRVTSSIDGSTTTIGGWGSSASWQTGTIEIACDDITQHGWIPAGGRESLRFEHRAVAGDMTTYSIAVAE